MAADIFSISKRHLILYILIKLSLKKSNIRKNIYHKSKPSTTNNKYLLQSKAGSIWIQNESLNHTSSYVPHCFVVLTKYLLSTNILPQYVEKYIQIKVNICELCTLQPFWNDSLSGKDRPTRYMTFQFPGQIKKPF